MSATPHALLIRQIETVSHLEEGDRDAIRRLPLRMRRIEEDRDVLKDGQVATECCLLLSGVVCRYKIVIGGRQILSFHFAGDMPDLQSLYLERMDHGLAALTPVTVAHIPHAYVRNAALERPALAAAFHRQSLVDGSVFREWIANIGRRLAIERVSHLICECFERMRALGLTDGDAFQLPLTQTELGDATGLSTVHINRTLQTLRRDGLVQTDGKMHRILDWPRLRELADFNPAYLHLRPGVGVGAI